MFGNYVPIAHKLFGVYVAVYKGEILVFPASAILT
jgi:hypothetical protein